MDLTMNADQRAMRDALCDVLRATWPPERLRAATDVPAMDVASWASLAEVGVFGLLVAERDGGMGLDMADAAILVEELGYSLAPGPLVSTILAAELIPAAVTGKAIVTTVDTRDRTLFADHLAVATDLIAIDDDGLFQYPVTECVAEPVTRPLDPLTPVSALTLPTTPGERVGSADDAARWRSHGTILTAALQVGVAQGALDLAVRYAKQRVQFGRAIGSFQAVKHLLAESLVKVDLARAAVLVAALSLADDDVSSAKVLADAAATEGGRCGVQVHGGMGFTWEVLAHLFVKRAWVLATAFGTADEHAQRLADAIIQPDTQLRPGSGPSRTT
ncbi:MAG TPA: acyl-CoA dehydrogenase family protein [Pseudonocardiaceae bacterium]|jgi:alkylation response protein AidB-like acyl-CoA dehydrogenase